MQFSALYFQRSSEIMLILKEPRWQSVPNLSFLKKHAYIFNRNLLFTFYLKKLFTKLCTIFMSLPFIFHEIFRTRILHLRTECQIHTFLSTIIESCYLWWAWTELIYVETACSKLLRDALEHTLYIKTETTLSYNRLVKSDKNIIKYLIFFEISKMTTWLACTVLSRND